MSGASTARVSAVRDQIVAVLRDAGPVPLSTPEMVSGAVAWFDGQWWHHWGACTCGRHTRRHLTRAVVGSALIHAARAGHQASWPLIIPAAFTATTTTGEAACHV